MLLLQRVERYLRKSGTPPTKFGREAARDPRLVLDMRRGRQVGPRLGGAAFRLPGGARRRGTAVTGDATSALLRAVQGKFAPSLRLSFEEIVSRSWASATFVGARHEVTIALEGEESEAAADRFVGGLAAEEFALRGHILADIALVSRDHAPGRARIALEALTVEDA